MGSSIEDVGLASILALFATFIGVMAGLLGLLMIGWKRRNAFDIGSPYSKEPLIYGGDIAKTLEGFIQDFLLTQPQPDNPPIDMMTAVICRTTGRIFPNAVGVKRGGNAVRLGWNFIEKSAAGNYVSWGALSELEQTKIKLLHGGELEGYQLEESSKRLLPKDAEEYFKLASPGPLYVDRMNATLVGWKKVPGTHFEVVIVQRPKYKSIDETL